MSLIERLHKQGTGGCTCMTKTPGLEHHDEDCTYRVTAEAAQRIAELEVKNAKLNNYMKRVQDAVRAFEALKGEQ